MQEVLIVAHGSPSSPDGPEAWLCALARQVQALCPNVLVRAATLAKPGSLKSALEALARPSIYPFFMAEGWFTRKELPRRLAELGREAPILPPFGADPNLPALLAQALAGTGSGTGAGVGAGAVILAAHGSAVAPASKAQAEALAQQLGEILPGRQIAVGLIEEPPFLRDIAARHPAATCLPLFALRAGHVESDIPQALAEAGFTGRLLNPIGEHPAVPELIAQALARR